MFELFLSITGVICCYQLIQSYKVCFVELLVLESGNSELVLMVNTKNLINQGVYESDKTELFGLYLSFRNAVIMKLFQYSSIVSLLVYGFSRNTPWDIAYCAIITIGICLLSLGKLLLISEKRQNEEDKDESTVQIFNLCNIAFNVSLLIAIGIQFFS